MTSDSTCSACGHPLGGEDSADLVCPMCGTAATGQAAPPSPALGEFPPSDAMDFDDLLSMEESAQAIEPVLETQQFAAPAGEGEFGTITVQPKQYGIEKPPEVGAEILHTMSEATIGRIRKGTLLHYVAVCGYVLGMVIGSFGLAMVLFVGIRKHFDTKNEIDESAVYGALAIVFIGAATMFAALVIDVVGTFLLFAVPEQAGSRIWLILSTAIKFATPVLVLVGIVLLPPWLWYPLGVVLVAASWTLFVFGLRKYALYLQREEVAYEALMIIICALIGAIVVGAAPSAAMALLAAGQYAVCLTIGGGLILFLGISTSVLLRTDPSMFLAAAIKFFYYGSMVKPMIVYLNFLDCVRSVSYFRDDDDR